MKLGGSAPVLVLNQNTKRENGKKVQLGNVAAAKMIADVIRTCLGPRAMLKMLMDPMGGIVMTNDGNAILREITVQHPAAKSMIEISRTQDEEVGDGTTSVIILAGEMMSVAQQFLEQQMHPTLIISAYQQAMEDLIEIMREKLRALRAAYVPTLIISTYQRAMEDLIEIRREKLSVKVDVTNRDEMMKILKSCVGTKFVNKWGDLACQIAYDAVRTVSLEENGRKEIDIKRYAKVEKVPGGIIEDSRVLNGVMLNKDVTHPKMRRRIENPKILLLDCSLEYKKGESQTNLEISQQQDFARILQMEEEYIQRICEDIIQFKPDLVFTEKGISDLAQHFLVKANITAIRRVRKSDNNRIARACGATIVNRTDEIREEDLGTGAGLFEVQKFGDEYFTFVTECKDPKACTILLRGASKDILNEVERNLQDAMNSARNVMIEPLLVPGGGAVEMALTHALTEKAKTITGVQQWPYKAVATALEVIPRTLIQNCGGNTIRTLTALRAKHADPANYCWGIDGEKGTIVDMNKLGVWDAFAVKAQTYKTALETAMLLLRIDDIVSGTKKAEGSEGHGATAPTGPMEGGGD